MKPGADALVDLAAKLLPPDAHVLDIGGPTVTSPKLAARRVTVVREDEALPFLHAHATDPFDAVLVAWPAHSQPLMPLLSAVRAALADQGALIACDLVWQTAPTPELVRAFAPAPGREKIRPIEGWEMQAEHSGFDIDARGEVERARWTPGLAPLQRAAVAADTRGAAKLATWVLRPHIDE